jgi:adenosylcobinamide amidohydrolase
MTGAIEVGIMIWTGKNPYIKKLAFAKPGTFVNVIVTMPSSLNFTNSSTMAREFIEIIEAKGQFMYKTVYLNLF